MKLLILALLSLLCLVWADPETEKELKSYLEKMGKKSEHLKACNKLIGNLTGDIVKNILSQADKDNDGNLCYAEYELYMIQKSKTTDEEKETEDILRDVNTLSDLKKMYGKLGIVGRNEEKVLLEKVDPDNKGKLNKEALKEFFKDQKKSRK